ncbi:hypothetical protein BC828DRAFT_334229, partial [Blastocladiella britannica]
TTVTTVLGIQYPADSWTNATPHIVAKTERALHRTPHHPVAIVAQRIAHFWSTQVPDVHPPMRVVNDMPPVATPAANFDSLLIAPDHPGRSPSDTYYLNQHSLLRTHTSAHQAQLLARGVPNFLCIADCYRRDEIDASHYPVFHQMEGFRSFEASDLKVLTGGASSAFDKVWDPSVNPKQTVHDVAISAAVGHDLVTKLEAMCRFLFESSQPLEMRWNKDYFPFTAPSWELEVKYQGQWLEVLGSGVVQQPIMDAAHPTRPAGSVVGWAFGLGLERLAMVLFGIPDIRLFWSTDPRFLDQFKDVDPTDPASLVTFKPFSAYPPCTKDVAFWVPKGTVLVDNNLFDVVRGVAGDLVENVQQIDRFVHPKTGRESRCFRIVYRSMDRNVTNDEINAVQDRVRAALVNELQVELR